MKMIDLITKEKLLSTLVSWASFIRRTLEDLEEWLSQAGRFPTSVKKVAFDEGNTRQRTSDKPQVWGAVVLAWPWRDESIHVQPVNMTYIYYIFAFTSILSIICQRTRNGPTMEILPRSFMLVWVSEMRDKATTRTAAHLSEFFPDVERIRAYHACWRTKRLINIRTTVRRRATDSDCYNTILVNDARKSGARTRNVFMQLWGLNDSGRARLVREEGRMRSASTFPSPPRRSRCTSPKSKARVAIVVHPDWTGSYCRRTARELDEEGTTKFLYIEKPSF